MHAFLPAGGASGTADVASGTGGGAAFGDAAGGWAGAPSPKNHYMLLTDYINN